MTAERRTLARLGAGCHAPVGVVTAIERDTLSLEAVVLSRDAKRRLYAKASGPVSEPEAVGDQSPGNC